MNHLDLHGRYMYLLVWWDMSAKKYGWVAVKFTARGDGKLLVRTKEKKWTPIGENGERIMSWKIGSDRICIKVNNPRGSEYDKNEFKYRFFED